MKFSIGSAVRFTPQSTERGPDASGVIVSYHADVPDYCYVAWLYRDRFWVGAVMETNLAAIPIESLPAQELATALRLAAEPGTASFSVPSFVHPDKSPPARQSTVLPGDAAVSAAGQAQRPAADHHDSTTAGEHFDEEEAAVLNAVSEDISKVALPEAQRALVLSGRHELCRGEPRQELRRGLHLGRGVGDGAERAR